MGGGKGISSLSDEELLNQALRLINEGKSVALAIVVSKEGSGPRDVGSKMHIDEDGNTYGTLGGGSFERHVVNEAVKAIREGRPRMIKYSFTGRQVSGAVDTGLICGGILTVYIDVLRPSKRVIIFGTGRVGKPVTEIFRFLKFRVVIADPKPELVSEDYIPHADVRITGSVDEIASKLKSIIREGDIVLVLHGEVETDYRMVKELMESKANFIGLLGSRRKVTEFIKKLVSEGIPKEVIKSKLRAPIGIDLGSDKPEEIAISIAAEALSYINNVEPKHLSIVSNVIDKLRV